MRNFLILPTSNEDHENIRINLDFVVYYWFEKESESIHFEMVNGKVHKLGLHNIKVKNIMKRLDLLSKPHKLLINKTDVK